MAIWKRVGNTVTQHGHGIVAICPSPGSRGTLDFQKNTELIAAAGNAATEVNPANPLGPIKALPDAIKKLEEIEHCSHPEGLRIMPDSILADSIRLIIATARGE